MKTKKKIISWIFLAMFVAVFIFYACRKGESSVSTNSEFHYTADHEPKLLSRGTGTETFYSHDTDGVYYKMVLIWNSGAVSVDRSIVTSGYPEDTETNFSVEDGIDTLHIDNDANPEDYDTLKVILNSELKYYLIYFQPTIEGGYNEYLSGGTVCICCCCTKGANGGGFGYECKPKDNSGKGTYCAGCTNCTIDNHIGSEERISLISGARLVEATGITIIH